MCLAAKKNLDCKKKTSTSPTRSEMPLIKKTGRGTTERETGGQKERGVGMHWFMKKEDKSLM